jgi:hypothetical protein
VSEMDHISSYPMRTGLATHMKVWNNSTMPG